MSVGDDLERSHASEIDEKGGLRHGTTPSSLTRTSPDEYTTGEDGNLKENKWLFNRSFGAESRGIHPIPVEQRRNANFLGTSFIWLSANLTVAAFSTGALGPEVYGLDLRTCVLVIALFNVLSCGVPAYFSTFGPKLGLRQMTQSRYSFGFYGVIIPGVINMITLLGWCTVNSIVGGQTLVAASSNTISTTVGIVIIGIISLFVSFLGIKILHPFEQVAWIFELIAFAVLTGLGASRLSYDYPVAEPPTAGTVLSFASLIIAFSLSYTTIASDFNTYMPPDVSSYKVALCTFIGLYLPCTLIQLLGAAFMAAVPSVPEWSDAYGSGGIGGLLGEVFRSVGGFGKFCLVILALGLTTNNAPTIYSLSLNAQVVMPFAFLLRIPRFVFAVLATAIILPVAIVGADHFTDVLYNFLGLLGYWSTIWTAILLTEHLAFRRGRFENYSIAAWRSPKLLPPGIAALFAFVCGIGIAVPSMDQVYWRGPIAQAISGTGSEFGGDVGLELGFVVAILAYLPARWLEKRYFGR